MTGSSGPPGEAAPRRSRRRLWRNAQNRGAEGHRASGYQRTGGFQFEITVIGLASVTILVMRKRWPSGAGSNTPSHPCGNVKSLSRGPELQCRAAPCHRQCDQLVAFVRRKRAQRRRAATAASDATTDDTCWFGPGPGKGRTKIREVRASFDLYAVHRPSGETAHPSRRTGFCRSRLAAGTRSAARPTSPTASPGSRARRG